MFRKTLGAATIAALMGTSIAIPAQAADTRKIVKSGVIGGLGGAVVGAVVPGVSTTEGALIGGLGGAAVGALSKKKHKDRYGRTYYRDSQGRRVYR